MEKYRKVKSKVYAVFIDLHKAFDLVCRQALLFKLACYGVNGGFFHIIRDMYSNSTGHIKINGKISEAFQINKETEQGHPLSPELFKVYFQKLSELLNEAQALTNCPTLSGLRITYLAQWRNFAGLVIMAPPGSKKSPPSGASGHRACWGQYVKIRPKNLTTYNACSYIIYLYMPVCPMSVQPLTPLQQICALQCTKF